MFAFFSSLLDVSFKAGLVILVVLLLRLFLFRAPKKYSYLLWALVAFRLLIPVSIPSELSIFGVAKQASSSSLPGLGAPVVITTEAEPEQTTAPSLTPAVTTPSASTAPVTTPPVSTPAVTTPSQTTPSVTAPAVTTPPATEPPVTEPPVTETAPTESVPPVLLPSQTDGPQSTSPVPPSSPVETQKVSTPSAAATFDWDRFLKNGVALLWLSVTLLLLVFAVVSYQKLRKKLKNAACLEGNVFVSEAIDSPFALGFLHPRIYLPEGLSERERACILAHERYHLHRGDHIVKALSYLLLCLHWFNPLCWLAFHLMSRDMEMSCDEKILSDHSDPDFKKQYSLTLLALASKRPLLSASPIAFSDGGGAKKRILHTLSWKKPKLWVSLIAIVLCLTAVVICCTDAVTEKNDEPDEPSSALTYEQLREIEDFLNDEENNGFVCGNYYTSPQEIDLLRAFYNHGITDDLWSEQEKEDILAQGFWQQYYTTAHKWNRSDVEALLLEKTGLTLADFNNEIPGCHYVEAYDAFYQLHNDTFYKRFRVIDVTHTEEGTLAVRYYSEVNTTSFYTVTLQETTDGFRFVSNVESGKFAECPFEKGSFIIEEINRYEYIDPNCDSEQLRTFKCHVEVNLKQVSFLNIAAPSQPFCTWEEIVPYAHIILQADFSDESLIPGLCYTAEDGFTYYYRLRYGSSGAAFRFVHVTSALTPTPYVLDPSLVEDPNTTEPPVTTEPGTTTDPSTTEPPVTTEPSTIEPPQSEPLDEILISVFNNKQAFSLYGEEKYISDFGRDIWKYAIVDMDSDGKNELAVALDVDNMILILRENNGSVSGFAFSHRAMYKIDTDGAFYWHQNAGNTYGCSYLSFTETGFKTFELWRVEHEDSGATTYYINKTPVTKQQFETATANYQKPSVTWISVETPPLTVDKVSFDPHIVFAYPGQLDPMYLSGVSQGYAVVAVYDEDGEYFVYVSTEGQLLTSKRYTVAYPFDESGKALVQYPSGLWAYIDTNGQILSWTEAPTATPSIEGLVYEENGLYGICGQDGYRWTEPIFLVPPIFYDNPSYAYTSMLKDGKTVPVLVSVSGTTIELPEGTSDAYVCRDAQYNSRVICRGIGYDGEKVDTVFDTNGNEILSERYSLVLPCEGKWFAVIQDGKLGLLDWDGNVLIAPSIACDWSPDMRIGYGEGYLTVQIDGQLAFVKILEPEPIPDPPAVLPEGTPLNGKEITEITAFLNEVDNNGFVFDNVYTTPEEIDLLSVFYDTGIHLRYCGEDEWNYVLEEGPWEEFYLSVYKIERSYVEDLLLKRTGLSLSDYGGTIPYLYYLEKYDSFYMMRSDTCINYVEVVDGVIDENGFYVVRYLSEGSTLYLLTMRKTEDGYQFLSNIETSTEITSPRFSFSGSEIVEGSAEDADYVYTDTTSDSKHVLRISAKETLVNIVFFTVTDPENLSENSLYMIRTPERALYRLSGLSSGQSLLIYTDLSEGSMRGFCVTDEEGFTYYYEIYYSDYYEEYRVSSIGVRTKDSLIEMTSETPTTDPGTPPFTLQFFEKYTDVPRENVLFFTDPFVSPENNQLPFLLSVDETVKNVCFFSVDGAETGLPEYTLESWEELTADKPLRIETYLNDATITRGISYTDASGTIYYYGFAYDGSGLRDTPYYLTLLSTDPSGTPLPSYPTSTLDPNNLLTIEQLTDIQNFLNDYDNNGFVQSNHYYEPQGIDLNWAFYHGAGVGIPVEDLTDEELRIFVSEGRSVFNLKSVMRRSDIDAYLQKRTGLSLENFVEMDRYEFNYSEGLDAYFDYHTDSAYDMIYVKFGCVDEDGNYVVYYGTTYSNASVSTVVTLRPTEDGYQFISNLPTDIEFTPSATPEPPTYGLPEGEETVLTEAQLQEIEDYLNEKENNGFVGSLNLYNDPEYLDLFFAFSEGAGIGVWDRDWSEEEKEAFSAIFGTEHNVPYLRIDRIDLEVHLIKKLGMDFFRFATTTDSMIYCEELDAYFISHTDSNYAAVDVTSGYIDEDGEYVIQYNQHGYEYTVTLHKIKNGYQFLSNLCEGKAPNYPIVIYLASRYLGEYKCYPSYDVPTYQFAEDTVLETTRNDHLELRVSVPLQNVSFFAIEGDEITVLATWEEILPGDSLVISTHLTAGAITRGIRCEDAYGQTHSFYFTFVPTGDHLNYHDVLLSYFYN